MVLVRRPGRSRSALQHHKQRLARLIQEQMGADIMSQVQERPTWLWRIGHAVAIVRRRR